MQHGRRPANRSPFTAADHEFTKTTYNGSCEDTFYFRVPPIPIKWGSTIFSFHELIHLTPSHNLLCKCATHNDAWEIFTRQYYPKNHTALRNGSDVFNLISDELRSTVSFNAHEDLRKFSASQLISASIYSTPSEKRCYRLGTPELSLPQLAVTAIASITQ